MKTGDNWMLNLDLLATLQPDLPHFCRFGMDGRLAGLRLNNPSWSLDQLETALKLAKTATVPLYFDVKGWQLRVIEVHANPSFLDITINHPVSVKLPTPVVFKADADSALLLDIRDDGRRLIFHGGPKFRVSPGESLQIRHPSLTLHGEQFTPLEIEKIEVARAAGISGYFLSYVGSDHDVDQFRDLVGNDAQVFLKIESLRGLQYVAETYSRRPNTRLVAARGDLYVEVKRPHHIMEALQLVIQKDPQAVMGSRFMLSVIHEPVPACADFLELAWAYDQGYRAIMLCDELCLKEELLATAINACESFKREYHSLVMPIGENAEGP
jgi:pyruvate kinase